jgi:hypothetical protein
MKVQLCDKIDLQYCIMCEKMVQVIYPVVPAFPPYHTELIYVDGMAEMDACEGEFASCPPPEYNDEIWDSIFASEPA